MTRKCATGSSETTRQYAREKLADSGEGSPPAAPEHFMLMAENSRPGQNRGANDCDQANARPSSTTSARPLAWSRRFGAAGMVWSVLRLANAIDWDYAAEEGPGWLQAGLALIAGGDVATDSDARQSLCTRLVRPKRIQNNNQSGRTTDRGSCGVAPGHQPAGQTRLAMARLAGLSWAFIDRRPPCGLQSHIMASERNRTWPGAVWKMHLAYAPCGRRHGGFIKHCRIARPGPQKP